MGELPAVPPFVHGKPHEGSSHTSRTLSMGASSAAMIDAFKESSISSQRLHFHSQMILIMMLVDA